MTFQNNQSLLVRIISDFKKLAMPSQCNIISVSPDSPSSNQFSKESEPDSVLKDFYAISRKLKNVRNASFGLTDYPRDYKGIAIKNVLIGSCSIFRHDLCITTLSRIHTHADFRE